MKLSKINPEVFQTAIRIYFELAYPQGGSKIPCPDFSKDRRCEDALGRFQNESGRNQDNKLHRYILRLGNDRYPFMKMVIQEVLIEGEYFFEVDTHDEMEVKPNFPDYDQWKEIKNFNLKLKNEIERRWEKSGVPTYASLQMLAKDLVTEGEQEGQHKKILVVDDEPRIREAMAAILAAKGYWIETAGDGEEALEKLQWMTPDLIFLDYEMPGLDGLATIEKLRSDEKTRNIPVLLATAGQIELSKTVMANGFLVKPFEREVMFKIVRHLLDKGKKN